MFRAIRWHVSIPLICRIPDSRNELLNLWPSCLIAFPTILKELPQGIRDPDGFCVRRFARTNAGRDVVRDFPGLDVLEWLFPRQDLPERQEELDGENTARIPGVRPTRRRKCLPLGWGPSSCDRTWKVQAVPEP